MYVFASQMSAVFWAQSLAPVAFGHFLEFGSDELVPIVDRDPGRGLLRLGERRVALAFAE